MKLIFTILLTIFLFEGCGKKSEPKYQGKIKLEKNISA